MSYRAPTTEELKEPMFERVWQAIKDWDIRVPKQGGYMGATGNHVCEIIDAVKSGEGDIVQCECGQALLWHWKECHMCGRMRPAPQAEKGTK